MVSINLSSYNSVYGSINRFIDNIIRVLITNRTLSRSQWPLAGWGFGFESRQEHRCLYCECHVFSGRGLRQADHSSRGVLPSVVCLSVIVNPRQRGLGPLGSVVPM